MCNLLQCMMHTNVCCLRSEQIFDKSSEILFNVCNHHHLQLSLIILGSIPLLQIFCSFFQWCIHHCLKILLHFINLCDTKVIARHFLFSVIYLPLFKNIASLHKFCDTKMTTIFDWKEGNPWNLKNIFLFVWLLACLLAFSFNKWDYIL